MLNSCVASCIEIVNDMSSSQQKCHNIFEVTKSVTLLLGLFGLCGSGNAAIYVYPHIYIYICC